MYKGSADRLSYLARVSSHATKPLASGRIDEIPPWAQEPEAYYNSVRDRYRSLAEQLTTAREKLTEINETLRNHLPFKEFEHLRQHKERLGARVVLLQEQASDYRVMARAAGEKAWMTVFYCVAEKLLSRDDLYAIRDETREILARDPVEVGGGQDAWTPGKRANRAVNKKRRQRRARFQKSHGPAERLVWQEK
jgi:hypothetical protein